MKKDKRKIRFKNSYQSGECTVSTSYIDKAILNNTTDRIKYFNTDFRIDTMSLEYLMKCSTEVHEYIKEYYPERLL